MVTRRGLLAAAGGAVAGGAIASVVYEATTSDPARPGNAPPLDPDEWTSIRAQFPLQDGMTNLSTFYFASHSADVSLTGSNRSARTAVKARAGSATRAHRVARPSRVAMR